MPSSLAMLCHFNTRSATYLSHLPCHQPCQRHQVNGWEAYETTITFMLQKCQNDKSVNIKQIASLCLLRIDYRSVWLVQGIMHCTNQQDGLIDAGATPAQSISRESGTRKSIINTLKYCCVNSIPIENIKIEHIEYRDFSVVESF